MNNICCLSAADLHLILKFFVSPGLVDMTVLYLSGNDRDLCNGYFVLHVLVEEIVSTLDINSVTVFGPSQAFANCIPVILHLANSI